jgi:peptide/nickel transport system ATP-binding protein
MKERPLLTVRDLQVSYQGRSGHVQALRGVSFDVHRERLGIVGESGSGKSTIGLSILRLLPSTAHVTAKQLELHGTDLLHASERLMRGIRGRRISMILQDPKFSLNPVLTVGQQIAESYRVHTVRSNPRLSARHWKCWEL